MKQQYTALLMVFVLLLTLASKCKEQGNTLKLSKASSYLLGKKTEDAKWQLVKTYDPYNGGQTILPEENNPRYIEMSSDGSYLKYDNANREEGNWYLNPSKDSLALAATQQNGMAVDDRNKKPFFRFAILEFSDEKLVIAWQGRHGPVEETYQLVP